MNFYLLFLNLILRLYSVSLNCSKLQTNKRSPLRSETTQNQRSCCLEKQFDFDFVENGFDFQNVEHSQQKPAAEDIWCMLCDVLDWWKANERC